MMRISLIVVFLAAAGGVRAQDGGTLPEEDRARAESLIAALDGDDFDQRESSYRELLAMGRAVRPVIEAARERVGLEVRLRLEALLESLGMTVERAGVKLEPTLVSVEAETLEAAMAQLRRQGVRFMSPVGTGVDERVDVSLENRPLLEVLDALGDGLSMRWSIMARDGAVRFSGRTVGKPLRHYAGPFRFMLTAATRNSSLLFGDELRQTSYLQGVIDIEPGAPVLGIWHPPNIDEMVSPEGVSLIDDAIVQRPNFNPATNRTSFHFSARVKLPDPPPTTIAHLAGHVLAVVPKEYQVLSLPVSRKDVEGSVTAGGARAMLESFKRSKTTVELVVRVEREPVWADDQQRQQVKDQFFELVTVTGRTVAPAKQVTPRADPKGDRFQLEFATEDRPESLSIRVLKSIERREIAFDFRDVPLP